MNARVVFAATASLLFLFGVSPAAAKRITMRTTVISALPSTCDPEGHAYIVTDSNAAGTDCSTGGGSTPAWCFCNAAGNGYVSGRIPVQIVAGDSNITMADPGAGTATITIDASAVAVWNVGGLTIGGADSTDTIVLPQNSDASTPSLAFGDANTGFYEISDNTLGISMGGFQQWVWNNTGLRSQSSAGAEIMDAPATATNPVHVFSDDTDTGLGRAAANTGSLTAGGIESFRFNTVASGVNFVETTPAIATADPVLTVDGPDTNTDLVISGKGTGIVDLTAGATVATAAADTNNTEASSTAFVQQEHDDSAGSYTNQCVTAVNANAAPTCATVTPSDVDTALETRMPSFNIEGAVTGDDGNFQTKIPVASTLVRVSCSTTANAADIQFYERAENSPNTGTTSMLTGNLTCNSDTTVDATTSFADSAVAADAVLALGIKTSTLGSTDILRVYVEYTVD